MLIAVSFGLWLTVCAALHALPWGMPYSATVQRTPKVHLLTCYLSGFT